MAVLLGVRDEKVTEPRKTCFLDNKIGGSPDWPEVTVETPGCDVCGKQMLFIVQVYCPLNASPYHRILYIFGCPSKQCQNNSQCWKVLRCQLMDKMFQVNVQVPNKVATSDTWADDADEWDDDDGGGDHVASSNDTVAMVTGTPEGSYSNVSNLESSAVNEHLTNKLQSVVLDEPLESSTGKTGVEVMPHCTAEDLPIQSPEHSVLMSLGAQRHCDIHEQITDTGISNANNITLCSYYISVFDEPNDVTSMMKHERELLQQYLVKEGLDLANITTDKSSSDGAGEKYEKTSVKHGDRVFHRFHKRVSRCPEQLLRYSHNGSPLHIENQQHVAPVVCSYCGSQRVFELQLMPALVNLLRTSPETDPVIEFGTVLVYTCENSCWSEDAVWRQELALVEADPYEALLKPNLLHS